MTSQARDRCEGSPLTSNLETLGQHRSGSHVSLGSVESQSPSRPARTSRPLLSVPASTRSRSPGNRRNIQDEAPDWVRIEDFCSSKEREDLERQRATLAKEKEDLEREKAALANEKEEWARQRELFRVYDDPIIMMRRRDRVCPCIRRIFCFWRGPEQHHDSDTCLVPVGRDPLVMPLTSFAETETTCGSHQGDSSSVQTRAVSVSSYDSFRTGRSTSRALSSGFDGGSGTSLHSRSLSRTYRVGDRANGIAESSLPAWDREDGDPLELLRQFMTDMLEKFSLTREDPVIDMMVQPSSDAKSNATIKADLLQNQPGLRNNLMATFTPLMFRDLIYAFMRVLAPLRETELAKLLEIFENQWLIKVRPGANKVIDGKRSLADYEPLDIAYQYRGRTSTSAPYPLFRLCDVIEQDRRNHKPAGEGVLWAQRILELIEGLLRSLFTIMPACPGESLHQYRNRVFRDPRDWRPYWRENYSHSRLRLEVLTFVVGKFVDVKMKGSPAVFYPQAMVDTVFQNSVVAVEDFLLDLRIAMRLLDLLI